MARPIPACSLLAVLAALLAAPSPAPAGEQKDSPAVRCEVFPSALLSSAYWGPLLVEARNDSPRAADIDVGAITAQGIDPEALDLEQASASTRFRVAGDAEKRLFLYLPPFSRSDPIVMRAADGKTLSPHQRVFLHPNPGWKAVLLLSDDETCEAATVLENLLNACTAPPASLPERAEGFDAFHTVVLHRLDPAALSRASRRAIRDWTARGGHLVLSPGDDVLLFLDGILAEIHPFTPVDTLPDHPVTAFGALEPGAAPPREPLHLLEGGEPLLKSRRGEVVARWSPAGAGSVLALSASLDLLGSRSTAGRIWFLRRVLFAGGMIEALDHHGVCRETPLQQEFLASAATGPTSGEGLRLSTGRRAGRPHLMPPFRHYFSSIFAGVERDVTAFEEKEVLLALMEDLASAPSLGFVALFLLAFLAVVGPLNFLVLRRKRIPALASVTVPLVSTAFVFLVVVSGLVIRGGPRARRLNVVFTRSGESWAVANSLISFRTGAEGTYALSSPDGAFHLPPVPFWTKAFRLEQDGAGRLTLPLDRWDLAGATAERTIRLEGAVEAFLDDEGFHVRNRLPLSLRGLVMTPPPDCPLEIAAAFTAEDREGTFAFGFEVAPGASLDFLSPPPPARAPAREDLVLASLLDHALGQSFPTWGGGGLACWIDVPFPEFHVDGEPMELMSDRTALVIPLLDRRKGGAGG